MTAALDDSKGATGSELWSDILSSVGASRAVPTKNLIVLGEHGTGKSTLISHLSAAQPAPGNSKAPAARATAANSTGTSPKPGLGLTFSHADITDDSDEEVVARLAIYQLASSRPSFSSLLPLALNPSTLLDSLIIIVLDWERPWSFVDSLCAWLAVLKRLIAVLQARQDPSSGAQYALDEGRDTLDAVWRSYVEPAAKDAPSASLAPITRPTATDEVLPLPPGTLSDNLGLPIVCVCAKSDQIDAIERDKDFKEEQFDYIQQALRTICLQHGAALFYTSQFLPVTTLALRSYLLHRLFAAPAYLVPPPSAALTSPDKASFAPQIKPTPTSTSRTFPFTYRANVIDRDQVLVPLGWDSHGKIRVLRDGFDAAGFGSGWQLDVRQACGEQVDANDARTAEGKRIFSAVRSYRDYIVDHDATDLPPHAARARIEARDEQDFLRAHYETLQKEQAKDPRAQFQTKPSPNANDYDGRITSPSLVGPMASSSLSLPSVQRALERDAEEGPSAPQVARRDSAQLAPGSGQTPLSPTFPNASSPPMAGTANATAPLSPGGTQPTNEVLANFFQSLLASRAGSRGGAGSPAPGGRSASPSSSPQVNGRHTPDSGKA